MEGRIRERKGRDMYRLEVGVRVTVNLRVHSDIFQHKRYGHVH